MISEPYILILLKLKNKIFVVLHFDLKVIGTIKTKTQKINNYNKSRLMKQLLFLFMMCLCITAAQAQLLKKLKAKVDQSAKDVKTKVKEKAETAPDRVIDHTATKVETKAETKINNKENKANSKVDKTVDKVDSIKLKKQKNETAKDSVSGTAYRNVLQKKLQN